MKQNLLLILLFFSVFLLIAETTIQDNFLTDLAMADEEDQIKIIVEFANLPELPAFQRTKYLKQAVDITKKMNHEIAHAKSLYELGYSYNIEGDYERALSAAMEAITIYHKRQKTSEESQVESLIGMLYFYLEKFDLSQAHFKKALDIMIDLGDEQKIGQGMTNMGNALAVTGNLDEAMKYYEKALEINEAFNDFSTNSLLYNNIANIYFAKGELDEVLPYRLKALEIDRKTGDKWQIALKTYNLAEYYLTTNEPKRAYPYIIESKTIAENLGDSGLINDNVNFLSMYHEQINDLKKALEYQKLYSQNIKEKFSMELSEQVSEMEVKYETEKKEKENEIFRHQIEKDKLHKNFLYLVLIIFVIILLVLYYLYKYKNKITKILNKEITVRKKLENELELRVKQRTEELTIKTEQLELENLNRIQAEMKIKKEIKEKTLLLQELMHRTKNNMAVVSSMLSIKVHHTNNEYIKTTFNDIINKIKTMSLIHEKMFQAKDFSNINMKEYLEDLLKLLMQSNNARLKKIDLVLDLDEVKILFDTALPLGLVVNELISNIFKHAFPENRVGEIFIKLSQDSDEMIIFDLEDNGIGAPEEFDVRDNNLMGISSVLAIIERQLKGEISLNSQNGFSWQIKFKDNLKTKRV